MWIYNMDLEKRRNNKRQYNLDRLVLFGCGGHARSIINVIFERKLNTEILLVDNNADNNELILGCKAVCKYELKENDGYIIALGDNAKRREVYEYLAKRNVGYCISIISDYANMGVNAHIGNGIFVAVNAYIGPQVQIGNNTIINTGSIIEHEVQIGSNTHIAPKSVVCGRVKIGDNVFCGAGSTIIDKIEICSNVIVGAGAVVKENITESGTYVGVPAMKVK